MKTQTDIYNIYTLLAYLNKASIRLEMNRVEEAAYFINTVREAIKESLDVPNATDLQLTYICLQLAKYFSDTDDNQLASSYATKGLEFNRQNQRAYF